jgi:hypothetical protein
VTGVNFPALGFTHLVQGPFPLGHEGEADCSALSVLKLRLSEVLLPVRPETLVGSVRI